MTDPAAPAPGRQTLTGAMPTPTDLRGINLTLEAMDRRIDKLEDNGLLRAIGDQLERFQRTLEAIRSHQVSMGTSHGALEKRLHEHEQRLQDTNAELGRVGTYLLQVAGESRRLNDEIKKTNELVAKRLSLSPPEGT